MDAKINLSGVPIWKRNFDFDRRLKVGLLDFAVLVYIDHKQYRYVVDS